MIRHAVKAVPWVRVGIACGLVAVLMELVRWNPWVLWPLEGTAVGLLAGATAWCFDEPAAAVVDTLPRGPAWRAVARAPALALLLAGWLVVPLQAGPRGFFGHGAALLLQGCAAMAAGAAIATWARGRGEATPGLRVAAVVVPVSTAWALVRPLHQQLPIFPYGTSSETAWEASTAGWALLGAVSALCMVLSLTELAGRRSPGGFNGVSDPGRARRRGP
jgi:hypothetical protein